MKRASTRLLAALVVALVALTLVACGSDSDSDSSSGSASTGSQSSDTSANQSVADLVPEELKSKGTLTIATDASYAPMEFFAEDGKTIQGYDPDMAEAIGKVMGLKVEVVNAPFDSIIPGLAAKKYDAGMSSFTDTKEREQTVDFVTYFTAGTSFFVKADGGPDITDLDSLCGHSVAVEKGTTQQDDVQKQQDKCGGKKIKLLTFPDQNGANLAVSSGRADVGMADSPVADYQVKKSNGQFKTVGEQYGTAPFGIALPKDSGLAEAMLAAMKALAEDGTYDKILTKWGVEHGKLDSFVINGAES